MQHGNIYYPKNMAAVLLFHYVDVFLLNLFVESIFESLDKCNQNLIF